MTITIGSFSCNNLSAQPFGYEGEATDGLTSRTFLVSGLLTPTQWSALLGVYNTWRDTRINDPDTLYANNVGTTVSLSISSTNTISVTSLACWFTEPPRGEQVGTFISATATLVDAAQALAVLLRAQAKQKERSIAEDADVDCAQITAGLQRQKDEADCELAALTDGLADDFAAQALTREGIDAAAKAGAYAAGSTTLAAIAGDQASVELAEKQAQLAGRASVATYLAAVDLEQEAQAAEARADAYTADSTSVATLKGAEASLELLDKQAQVTARADVADDIAQADFELEAQNTQARAAALAANTSTVETLKGAEASIELLEKQAQLAGRAAFVNDLAVAGLSLEAQEAAARDAAYTANSVNLGTIRGAAAHIDFLERQADFTARAAYVDDLASIELSIEAQNSTAKAAAHAADSTSVEAIKAAESQLELLDKQATLSARAAVANDLAVAELELESQNATAQSNAYDDNSGTLGAISSSRLNVELKGKQADFAARAAFATDFAVTDLYFQEQEVVARIEAYTANSSTLQNIEASNASIELLEKQAALDGRSAVAEDLASIELNIEAQQASARETAYAADSINLGTIRGAAAHIDFLERQADFNARAPYVSDLASINLSIEAQDATAKATAYYDDSTSLAAIQAANINIEVLEKQAQVIARAAVAGDLATADLALEAQAATAKAGAYADDPTSVAAIKSAEANLELLDKTAQLAGRAAVAEDLATIDLELEAQAAEAQSAAYTANTATLASIRAAQANIELKGREAEVTARAAVAPDLAVADLSLQAIEASARADAYADGATELATIKASEAAVELADKEAALTARAGVADDLAAADLSLQALEATARAAAAGGNTSALEDIQAAAFATEQLEAAAKIAALNNGTTLDDLRDARALQAIYDKYIGEDLPDLGTVSIGGVTIKLLRPMDTYSDGPQVAMTAGGSSLITGPYRAHQTRRIEGILTSGTFATLISWYGTIITTTPTAGTWFPTGAPSATAEKFLVNGVVGTRYSVTLEAKSII